MHRVNAPLYLASGSATRQRLLTLAEIPFEVVTQDADEGVISLDRPLVDLVTKLAELKMGCVHYPAAGEGQLGFFLTADTMTLSAAGKFFGKPVDRAEAIEMLRVCRLGMTIASGFCLDKAIYKAGQWLMIDRVVGCAEAFCLIDIPEAFIDFYLDRVPFTSVSGAITIEGIGEQFVRQLRGSYSAILGLPMVEVRESLEKLGFFTF